MNVHDVHDDWYIRQMAKIMNEWMNGFDANTIPFFFLLLLNWICIGIYRKHFCQWEKRWMDSIITIVICCCCCCFRPYNLFIHKIYIKNHEFLVSLHHYHFVFVFFSHWRLSISINNFSIIKCVCVGVCTISIS